MSVRILHGDCRLILPTLPADSFDACVTSPPYYGLRAYLPDGHPDKASEIGLEPTLAAYLETMVGVMREVRRVLKPSGCAFLNVGDGYASGGGRAQAHQDSRGGVGRNGTRGEQGYAAAGGGFVRPSTYGECLKPKDLMMVPNRLAILLQDDGWWIRSEIIFHKLNPMPESVQGSHFSRHMVTVVDYERLSGLPYVDERSGDDWAGDMPSLSESEISRSKAPLSAERQRPSDRSGSGRTRGSQREEAASIGVGDGQGSSGSLSENGQSKDFGTHTSCCVSIQRERQEEGGRTPSGDEGYACADCSEETCERCVCQDGKDGSKKAPRLCKAQGCDCSRDPVHCGDVACLGSEIQEPLSLLQTASSSHTRPRDSGQQGREARRGEHRSSLPVLQLNEGQSDRSSLLVGCPGCDKCIQHHGYIFHMSAGRPTCAHEKVWLMTKSANYFFDAAAIAEPSNYPPGSGFVEKASSREGRIASLDPQNSFRAIRETRNARNVWSMASEPYRGAHYAVMPSALAERCIKAGCPSGGSVLDPFFGAGTTGLVADRLGRDCTGIELNPTNVEMGKDRVTADGPLFAEVSA